MSELERAGAGFIGVIVPLAGLAIHHMWGTWWVWLWLIVGFVLVATLPAEDKQPR